MMGTYAGPKNKKDLGALFTDGSSTQYDEILNRSSLIAPIQARLKLSWPI